MRKTSGSAVVELNHGPIEMVFIDAAHDYVNSKFDIEKWSSLVMHGGDIALLDTDNPGFAGTRGAVSEAAKRMHLEVHINGLVVPGKQ